jgi:LPXTG-motif cell wall-anchored protein
VSGDNGALTIAGLFVSDSVHATIDASQRCYVVEEIEAPAGFALPAGDSAKTAVTVKAGVSAAVEKSIPNTRLSGVRLPMTGSDGLVVFSVVGAGLVALGLAVAVVSRRRRSQTA